MSRKRSIGLVAVVVLVLAGLGVFGASAAPPATADATAVTQWNLIAVSTITGVPGPGLPGPAGGAPPASQVNMGMVQGAVYDAVNAITPKHHRPYLLNRRFGNTASDDAAVATAAYLVLKNIVETVPQSIAFPTRAALLTSLETQYNASKNAIPDSPFKNMGIAAGTAAAQAMIDARQGDGRFGPSQWVPNTAPGTLVAASRPGERPDSVGRRREAVPHGQLVAIPQRWATRSHQPAVGERLQRGQSEGQGDRLHPHGRADVHRQVVAEQPRRELERRRPTAHSTESPRRRRQRPSPRDAEPCGSRRGDQHLERQVPLRLLAAVERDRRASEDGNPATVADDPNWTALITAPYPDHVSGHLGLDSSHTGVLRMFFGDAPAGGYQITSASALLTASDPKTRSFTGFNQASTRSSRPASGRGSTTAPRTCRP